MAAPNFKLDNLWVFIDHNNFQQTGSNNNIMNLRSLKDKWESFGWQTIEINGHDIDSILQCLKKIKILINRKQ